VSDRRALVVNADDFGRCRLINAGIVRAHEEGIVTSASLMVRWPGAREAAEYARNHPALGVGLHLDFGEWAYDGGAWPALYEVVSLDDAQAVTAEARAQLDAFKRLLRRDPTHIDSHQHVHLHEPLATVAAAVAGELSVPLRHREPRVRYCGDFYGQTREGLPMDAGVSPDHLIEILEGLPAGFTELACHPGEGTETDSVYVEERRPEVESLCDPRVAKAIEREGIRLCTFAEAGA